MSVLLFFLTHQLQSTLFIYTWLCGLAQLLTNWGSGRGRGATLIKKTDFPSPGNYQLPRAPHLWVGLFAHLPFPCWYLLPCLSLLKSCVLSGNQNSLESDLYTCACCYKHCECLCANALLCVENTTSLWSATASGSYCLSALFSTMISEPWKEACPG